MTTPGTQTRGRFAAIVGASLLGAAAAAAQQASPESTDTMPAHRIDEVTVTVTRAAADRYSLPRQIDVVDRGDIERTPATELADVLKKHATVDVIQFPGLLSGVGIRGFRPQFSGINQRTLVLVDGRPAGATNLALLGLSDVERIEVLRGPASSLFGSAAMGGVVNVVTRRSGGPVRGSARLGYGAWDTRELVGTAGGNLTSSLDFDATLSRLEQGRDYRVGEGNLFRDRVGETAVVRTFPDGTTEESLELGDGEVRPFSEYATSSGSVRVGYRVSQAWRVDVRTDHFEADRVQNPGDLFATWGDSRSLKDVARTSADAAARGSVGGHELTLRAFGAREAAANYNRPEAGEAQPQFVSFESRNRWHGLQLQDVFSTGAHEVVAGLDYAVAEAASDRFAEGRQPIAPWEPDSRIASRSIFAEARLRSPDRRLVATVGGRLDHLGFEVMPTRIADGSPDGAISAGNRESFTVFNPTVGLQYTAPAGIRLHATGGRAFVAPGAFNVAAHVERRSAEGEVAVTRGNPDLRPEHSFTWDAGAGIVRPDLGIELDATYFRTRVRDRITTLGVTPQPDERTPGGETITAITTYANADEANVSGLEWRLAIDLTRSPTRVGTLRLVGGATHVFDAEEVLSGVGRPVRNVADLTVNGGLELSGPGRFASRLSGRYVGRRTDDDWNTWPAAVVRYPAFLTLDWTGEVRLGDRYGLGLLVSNLTDENYYEVRGYPLPGRAAQVRLSVDF